MSIPFVQIPEIKDNKIFNNFFKNSLQGRRLSLILYNPEDYENNETKAILNGIRIPIQYNTCRIMRAASILALAFNGTNMLSLCVGKPKREKIKEYSKAIEESMQKVEDVLGKVPVVEELRKSIEEYKSTIREALSIEKVNNDE